MKGGIYLFLFSFWKRQVHSHQLTQHGCSNVVSTKSEEQEVNLVWPNLCIFWLLFICLYRSWSRSLPNFVWMNISGYKNDRSSLLTGFRAEKNHIFRCCAFWGSHHVLDDKQKYTPSLKLQFSLLEVPNWPNYI
jgi:hypothetical protein